MISKTKDEKFPRCIAVETWDYILKYYVEKMMQEEYLKKLKEMLRKIKNHNTKKNEMNDFTYN